MIALVTGGTGFVGQAVLRQLCAAGHQPRLLARRPDAPPVRALAERWGAEVRAGDVLEAATLAPALAGAEAVIHLVGIISEVGRQTFENLHPIATGNVLTAARQAGVERFVHMSALGTRPDAVTRYHRTKWAAEERLRGSGLAWTIFRPSLIYGPGDQFVNRFAKMARRSPVLPVFGSGRGRLQPVAVDIVARCFVAAVDQPRTVSRTFHLCGPERLTMVEILRTILDVLGLKRRVVRVPMGLGLALAAVLEVVCPNWLQRASPLTREQLRMLQEDNTGDPQAAVELSGRASPSFRDGIAAYLKPAA